MSDKERVNSARACKWVDEVHFPALYYPSVDWLRENGFDYIAHDCIPYDLPGTEDCYKGCKEAGIFLPIFRTSGIATTDLINRILQRRVRKEKTNGF